VCEAATAPDLLLKATDRVSAPTRRSLSRSPQPHRPAPVSRDRRLLHGGVRTLASSAARSACSAARVYDMNFPFLISARFPASIRPQAGDRQGSRVGRPTRGQKRGIAEAVAGGWHCHDRLSFTPTVRCPGASRIRRALLAGRTSPTTASVIVADTSSECPWIPKTIGVAVAVMGFDLCALLVWARSARSRVTTGREGVRDEPCQRCPPHHRTYGRCSNGDGRGGGRRGRHRDADPDSCRSVTHFALVYRAAPLFGNVGVS